MSNYLELKTPIRQSAKWFVNLRRAMAEAKIPVRWQPGGFHLTVAFISNDNPVKALSVAFDKQLSGRQALLLTFDKVDAFEAKAGDEFILHLTTTQLSPTLQTLVDSLRKGAMNAGADIENDFILHVTLGRIDTKKATLEQVRQIAESIQVSPFTLLLQKAEYRYFRGKSIIRWTMNQTINIMTDYRTINRQVMTDTKRQYESIEALKEAINNSIRHQYMVTQEENIDHPIVEHSKTLHVCSGKRSFEAAKAYKGKKTAVLNFANNHAIGGAPFSAGAQEESLCRCSTLLPCLEAMREPFYDRHISQYMARQIGPMGNDDLIYTPNVVVFKSDERTDPVYPKMMEQNEWYKVDVITCAAPELKNMRSRPSNYEEIITSRIKKILDVAAKEQVEVLVLGAWGCGAFKNPSDVVARVFRTLLKNYNFETVEFALASRDDISGSPFARME